MAPNWLGVTDDAIERAATIAGTKYVAFVADMYGGGKISAGPPEVRRAGQWAARGAPERRRRIPQRSMRCAPKATSAPSAISRGRRRQALLRRRQRAGARARRRDLRPSSACTAICSPPLPAKPGDIKAAVLRAARLQGSGGPKKDRDTFEAGWRRAARNGRCWFSTGCCIRFAESSGRRAGDHLLRPRRRAAVLRHDR